MNSIKEWLELMQEHRASDLHLSAGSVPYMRIDGDLVKIDHGVLSDRELRAMLYDILTEEQKRLFEQEGSLDFGWDNSVVRYRQLLSASSGNRGSISGDSSGDKKH